MGFFFNNGIKMVVPTNVVLLRRNIDVFPRVDIAVLALGTGLVVGEMNVSNEVMALGTGLDVGELNEDIFFFFDFF
jgi:hypothetical protein